MIAQAVGSMERVMGDDSDDPLTPVVLEEYPNGFKLVGIPKAWLDAVNADLDGKMSLSPAMRAQIEQFCSVEDIVDLINER